MAGLLAIGIPLLFTGVLLILMSNPPGQRPCKGWTLGDGFRCWQDWFACRLLGRCK